MATALPDDVWARIQAERAQTEAQCTHILSQIITLLPPETATTPALARDDLLRVLLLCKQLERLDQWDGWRAAVKQAALLRYLGDSGVSAVLSTPAPVRQLYAKHPSAWDDYDE